jgi:hypothetical protein
MPNFAESERLTLDFLQWLVRQPRDYIGDFLT